MKYLPYLLAGLGFGFVMVKSEAASWYRIMEMFYFQSFHMFGIMMTAIATGLTGVLLIKRLGQSISADGQPIEIPDKDPGWKNYLIGSVIFGLGWGIIGLCPGPIFALVGMGSTGAVAALVGALLGTWLYGCVKKHLPH